MFIKVEKLLEAGFAPAMVGLALNKNQDAEDMPVVAAKLASMDAGHNKFMEHIVLWFAVTAPRYWWQDADTYRLTSKQSQSTNHTILRRELEYSDFEDQDIDLETLMNLNHLIRNKEFLRLKKHLPEGFLQTREWRMDYQTLRRIIIQRRGHKLPHWPEFIRLALNQVEHPEFLPALKEEQGAVCCGRAWPNGYRYCPLCAKEL